MRRPISSQRVRRHLLALSHCLLLGWAGLSPAWADRYPWPADTPQVYQEECGACHMAYPPALLNTQAWGRVLATLDQHFGSDARLEPPALRQITAYLARHGSSRNDQSSGHHPPRISDTAFFVRKHRELGQRWWRDPRVRSAANCEACHRQASNGRFSEHDQVLPELRRK